MAKEQVTKHRSNFKDLTGQHFGRYTVIAIDHEIHGKIYWYCRCSCGNYRVVHRGNLTGGSSNSCGCLRSELNHDRNAATFTKHGMHKSREWTSWKKAKSRCHNPNDTNYSYYGGRGIEMAPDWRESFERFYSDMGACGDGLTLDRIDVNGPYSKTNCRWASRKRQSNNRRNNLLIKHNGETHTQSEWADIFGISEGAIAYRRRVGLPLFAPTAKRKSLAR